MVSDIEQRASDGRTKQSFVLRDHHAPIGAAICVGLLAGVAGFRFALALWRSQGAIEIIRAGLLFVALAAMVRDCWRLWKCVNPAVPTPEKPSSLSNVTLSLAFDAFVALFVAMRLM